MSIQCSCWDILPQRMQLWQLPRTWSPGESVSFLASQSRRLPLTLTN